MKSIKKTLRTQRLKAHEQIKAWLQPKLGSIGTKLRLAPRIRLANIWARKHPKRTFAAVAGTLSLLLLASILTASIDTDKKQGIGLDSIASMEPLFNGFRTIQANKELHRTALLKLTDQGQTLRMELDSLINLPEKSPTDSVRIISLYRQLEDIV